MSADTDFISKNSTSGNLWPAPLIDINNSIKLAEEMAFELSFKYG